MELEKFKVICDLYGEVSNEDPEDYKQIKKHLFDAIIREIDRE